MTDGSERFRNAELLVVDDDNDLSSFVSTLFELRGANCTRASDGVEALEEISKKRFDLVVTDIRMPSPSGLQLVAMARSAGATVPFLVLTAFPGDDVSDMLDKLDRTALVAKPFQLDDLVQQSLALLESNPERPYREALQA